MAVFLYLLVYVFAGNYVVGEYSLTGSADYAVSGSAFTFSCTIDSSQKGIKWYIDNDYFNIYQGTGTNCITGKGTPTEYVYSCSGETVYNLTINSVSFSQHGTVWKCGYRFGGNESPPITLQVYASDLQIQPCIPKWYEGVSLQLTCVHISGIIQGNVSILRDGSPVIQCNSTFGNCFSMSSAKFSIVATTSTSVTMKIIRFNRIKDVAVWSCADTSGSAQTTCNISESAIFSVRDNGLTSLQTQIITPPFSVSVTGHCTYLMSTCTWKYTVTGESERNMSYEFTTRTRNSASCNSGDIETTCTLQFSSIPAEFTGKSLNLAVSISHPSLPDSPLELRSSAVITFPKPPATPSLSGQCPDSYIISGQTGTCVCSTTDAGIPTGSVTWITPDGTDTRSTSLQLNSILHKFNNRAFTCTATNTVGAKHVTFTPKLAFGPDRVAINGNHREFDADGTRTLTLTCASTSASPSVTFVWRNGSSGPVITSDEPIEHSDAGDGGKLFTQNFVLNPKWFQDGDEIKCEVINSQIPEIKTKNSITLSLIYPPPSPPQIKGYQTGTPVYERDTLRISCEVKGGNPVVSSVNISCYGGHQSRSSRVEGDTVIADLSFQISRNLNSKTCQCSASHRTNRYRDTDQETVTVYYPPSVPFLQVGAGGFPWLEGPKNKYLNCSVTEQGNPPCTYVWFRDDVINSSQTSNTWTFSLLSNTDNGRRFYCQAENNYTLHKHDTKSSNNLTLNVYYKPRVTLNHESSLQVKESQLLLLTCSSESRPGNATLNWFWGSQLVSSDRVLQIPRFTKDHQGVYTCRATVHSPLFGLLQGSANTTVRVMERFPDSCYCTGSSETSLTLQWIYNTSSDAYSFTILQNVGDDNEWTDLSSSKPRRDDDVFSLNVAQLQHTSRYYFKISIYGGGDHSGYCLTSCKTDAPPSITSRGLTGGAGIAVGAVVGIVVTSLVFIIVIILWRRGFLFKFSKSDTKQDETNTYQDIYLDNRTVTEVDTELSQTPTANTYESLENREATPYCQLQLYENIKH